MSPVLSITKLVFLDLQPWDNTHCGVFIIIILYINNN